MRRKNCKPATHTWPHRRSRAKFRQRLNRRKAELAAQSITPRRHQTDLQVDRFESASASVIVTIQPEHLIEFSSQLFAGLYDLRASGEIRLKLQSKGFPLIEKNSIHKQVVPMRVVSGESHGGTNIVFDLTDGYGIASSTHLSWADVYFKASYNPSLLDCEGAEKIQPFGLRYACTSPNESLLDRIYFASLVGRAGAIMPTKPWEWARRLLSHPLHLTLGKFTTTAAYSRIPPR